MMKIERVTTYLLPGDLNPLGWCPRKAFLLVRVDTDGGLSGWGEAYTLAHREKSTAGIIEAIGAWLTGKDPRRIKAFTHDAYRVFGEWRAGIDLFCAVSGVEIALWDILGKSLGAPVHQLLGGACRDRIEVYANIWSPRLRSAAELARKAADMVERGFGAIKFYPFAAGDKPRAGVDKVRAVREAVGPDVVLAIDLFRGSTPAQAVAIAHLLEPYDIALIEDPVAPDSPAVLRTLADRVRQPLMVGETLATKRDFRELFATGAVGLINPDVAACGGILELREIAAMAEPHFIEVSPHNYNSMAVGLAATVNAAAGIPNLYLTEYFPELAPASEALCLSPMVPSGSHIELPTSPGLGVQLDGDMMEPFRID